VSNVGYISCTRKPTQPLDYSLRCLWTRLSCCKGGVWIAETCTL